MTTCCVCCEQLKSKYLIPKNTVEEIIILTDKSNNVGMIDFVESTMFLNNSSLNLIKNIFINGSIKPVYDLIINNKDAEDWIFSLVNGGILELTDEIPKKTLLSKVMVNENSPVNPGTKFTQVNTQEMGMRTVILINNVSIYFFEGERNFQKDNNSPMSLLYNIADNTKKLHGTGVNSVSPTLLSGDPIGDKCSACGVCASCGLCAFCAEINFGVGGIAVTATTITVKVADIPIN